MQAEGVKHRLGEVLFQSKKVFVSFPQPGLHILSLHYTLSLPADVPQPVLRMLYSGCGFY